MGLKLDVRSYTPESKEPNAAVKYIWLIFGRLSGMLVVLRSPVGQFPCLVKNIDEISDRS